MTAETIAQLAALSDNTLHRQVHVDGARPSIQFLLYAALRREQAALVVTTSRGSNEASRILTLAQSAYRDLQALLIARPTAIDAARDGDWTLRDLLRHAIATELRYSEQVQYSATRQEHESVKIPDDRLPCDRLTPPEREYGETRTGSLARVLELLGVARERTDRTLSELPTTALDRPSLWGAVPMAVRERIHQIAAHLVEAALHSEKMLRSTGAVEDEAQRLVRRLWATRGLHERASDASSLALLDGGLERIAALSR